MFEDSCQVLRPWKQLLAVLHKRGCTKTYAAYCCSGKRRRTELGDSITEPYLLAVANSLARTVGSASDKK